MLAPETNAYRQAGRRHHRGDQIRQHPDGCVEELIDNLGKEKIIGAVINRFDARTSRYYGYRKYGKYYRSKPEGRL